MPLLDRRLILLEAALLVAGTVMPGQARHHTHSPAKETTHSEAGRNTTLRAPGQSAFGAVQEAIQHLETDSTID